MAATGSMTFALKGFENVTAGSGHDSVTGSNNILITGGGNDTV